MILDKKLDKKNEQHKIKVYYGLRIRKIHQNIDLPVSNGDIKKIFSRGDKLLVKTNRGEELGEVVLYPVCARKNKKENKELYIKQVVRKAEKKDIEVPPKFSKKHSLPGWSSSERFQ